MTQPISVEAKECVVQQHIEGLGRNMIAKSTGLSRGSVTNILKGWRERGNSGIPSQPVASLEAVTFSRATSLSPEESTGMGMGSFFLNRVANPTTTSQENPLHIDIHSHPSTPELSLD